MTCFTGIWVALVTPFRDGEIDFPALHTLVHRIFNAGASGLVVCGSTGEAAALSDDEQLAVLDAVMKSVPACPVIMGLAGNNMHALLSMQKSIQKRSIAGLLVPPPYYIRPSQDGIKDYFRIVADAASVPIIVYNIPYRTGVRIELETMREIARHERVVALKDCGGDQAMTIDLINDSDLSLLTGEDEQIFSTLCLGGAGAIAASANICPDLLVRITQLVGSGEWEEARRIFYRLLPLIRLLFSEPNPAPLKEALALMGLMQNEVRVPLKAASRQLSEKLRQELIRLDCL